MNKVTMTIDDDIKKIGITKEDAKKLADLIEQPGIRGSKLSERTLQVILRLLMIMSNDLTAIRDQLEKREFS
jgi:hypothetical protein